MSPRAAVTVHRPIEEVQRLWSEPESFREANATVRFEKAPGDRGTEIHVEIGRVGLKDKVTGGALAKVKDELRHFKQRIEAGDIARSDGTPEGERVERKFKRRPAQPLEESELEKAGVR